MDRDSVSNGFHPAYRFDLLDFADHARYSNENGANLVSHPLLGVYEFFGGAIEPNDFQKKLVSVGTQRRHLQMSDLTNVRFGRFRIGAAGKRQHLSEREPETLSDDRRLKTRNCESRIERDEANEFWLADVALSSSVCGVDFSRGNRRFNAIQKCNALYLLVPMRTQISSPLPPLAFERAYNRPFETAGMALDFESNSRV